MSRNRGATDYVVMPFSPTELAARIRDALRWMKAAEAAKPPFSCLYEVSVGSQAAEPHLEDGTAYRLKWTYRVPSHNSKTVLSIVKNGPLDRTRTTI